MARTRPRPRPRTYTTGSEQAYQGAGLPPRPLARNRREMGLPLRGKPPLPAPPPLKGGGRLGEIAAYRRQQGWYPTGRPTAYPEYPTYEDLVQETPPLNQEQTAQALPNYDRLTAGEKWLYGKLPGFSESSVGKALASFSESWAGKALSYFDVLAEGLERTSGFVTQAIDAAGSSEEWDSFTSNIGAAWYAGSLGADMGNLPELKVYYDRKKYKDKPLVSVSLPGDLPGVSGLTSARQQIADLVRSGYDYRDALELVRSGYYEDRGALALRGQMQDTLVHIFADPLNYILPRLRPVDAAFLRRSKILTERITDASKIAEELSAAEKAGDAVAVERLTAAMGEARKLDLGERMTIALTGGLPLQREEELSRVGRTLRRAWWNPFALRPAARAHEMLTMVTDHVGAYVLSRMDDPHDIAQTINRAARGALGPEFGHAFLTLEGRVAQGALGGIDALTQKLIADWDLLAPHRLRLQAITEAIGSTPEKVLETILKGDAQALAARLGTTVDDLAELKLLENFYSPELFKWTVSNAVADVSARLGVTMFGVGARGMLEKMAATLKAGETLAFLRLNPAFPIKNFFNNEFTMYARGVGNVSSRDIEKFIDNMGGFQPVRLSQAYTIAGDLKAPGEAGARVIADALNGERGFLNRLGESMQNIKLGKLDMGELAQRAERSASRRAFVSGYMQAFKQYWRPGRGFDMVQDYLKPDIVELMEKARPGITRSIQGAVQDAWKDADIDGLTRGNLNLTMSAILDDASRRAGFDVRGTLDETFLNKIEGGLKEAAQSGKAREYMVGVRQDLQEHLDEIMDKAADGIADHVAAKVQLEGPKAYLDVFSDYMDEFWGAHMAHAEQMERIQDLVRQSDNYELINATWKRIKSDNMNHFNRAWKRVERALAGMQKGAKKAGIGVSDEVLDSFKQWRTETREFFTTRNRLWDAFHEARLARKAPPMTAEAIRQQVDEMYRRLVLNENNLTMKMDEVVSRAIPDADLQRRFLAWRDRAAELRRLDKEGVIAFFEEARGLSPKARQDAFVRFWQQRMGNWAALRDNDRIGMAMMQGDPNAEKLLEAAAAAKPANQIRRLASKYGIPSITEEGIPLDRRLLNTVNKYLPEDAPKYERLEDIPAEIAEQAFIRRAEVKGIEIPAEAARGIPPVQQPFVADASRIINPEPPIQVGEDQFWLNRGLFALDSLEEAAIEQARKAPTLWDDLPDAAKGELERYLSHVKGQMSDSRYASLRYAEYKRDAALLNYNRRTNFNTYLGIIAPYEFWFTQSVAKWALHTLDRPAMLSTYLRLKKLWATAGAPNQAIPSRLKNSLRIKMPFLPEWMGDSIWVDPMRLALPFDTLLYPLEQTQRNMLSREGRAIRLIEGKIENGDIDPADGQTAIQSRSGDIWEQAVAEALENDASLKVDAFDFMQMMTSPHAPIVWGMEVLKGTPEDIQPFTPMSRMAKGVAGLLGVDWDNSPLNIEARVRRKLGLPAFDKWDDYRIDRMLSNLTITGEIGVQEALRAMIDREGPAYDLAVKRANKEFGVGAIGSMLGIPTKAYPTGEFLQRSLKDDFDRAYELYEQGNVEILRGFFDKHPEYETRLALFKTPEERLRNFIIDELWNTYNNFSDLNKREMREQLGEDFLARFLNKETRSTDDIPLEQLQIWIAMLGGDAPGKLSSVPSKIKLTDPRLAWRAQAFYDTRNQLFPAWYDQQNVYFDLKKGQARKDYLRKYPELKAYWDWRRDFFHRNPDIVPYLSDTFEFEYESERERQAAYEAQPSFTWDEWRMQMTPSLSRIVEDYTLRNTSLSTTAEDMLEDLAERMGMTLEELLYEMEGSLISQ